MAWTMARKQTHISNGLLAYPIPPHKLTIREKIKKADCRVKAQALISSCGKTVQHNNIILYIKYFKWHMQSFTNTAGLSPGSSDSFVYATVWFKTTANPIRDWRSLTTSGIHRVKTPVIKSSQWLTATLKCFTIPVVQETLRITVQSACLNTH